MVSYVSGNTVTNEKKLGVSGLLAKKIVKQRPTVVMILTNLKFNAEPTICVWAHTLVTFDRVA